MTQCNAEQADVIAIMDDGEIGGLGDGCLMCNDDG
jgi:hypothetical protein